jgi:DNA-binding NtrC family response regulator
VNERYATKNRQTRPKGQSEGVAAVSRVRLAGQHPDSMPQQQQLQADTERQMIETALAATGVSVAGPHDATVKLGIPRQTLDSKIAALRIDTCRLFKKRSRSTWGSQYRERSASCFAHRPSRSLLV